MANDGRFVTTAEAARILNVYPDNARKIAADALYEKGGPGRPNLYWRHKIERLNQARVKRLCVICSDQPARSHNNATCGHPRCVREYRASRARMTRQSQRSLDRATASIADMSGAKIILAYQETSGMEYGDRLIITSRKTGESMATVMGVLRKRGLM